MTDNKYNPWTLADVWLGFLLGFITGATLATVLVLINGGSVP